MSTKCLDWLSSKIWDILKLKVISSYFAFFRAYDFFSESGSYEFEISSRRSGEFFLFTRVSQDFYLGLHKSKIIPNFGHEFRDVNPELQKSEVIPICGIFSTRLFSDFLT